MASLNGQNFTTFTGINTRGTIAFRFAADVSGNESTLSVRPSLDSARAWFLPDKTGTLPIMGTFQVDVPALSATTSEFSTIVTVSGIRAEDALAVLLNRGITAGYDPIGVGSGSTARILLAAKPGNGNITLSFFNALGATAAASFVYSYLAMR